MGHTEERVVLLRVGALASHTATHIQVSDGF